MGRRPVGTKATGSKGGAGIDDPSSQSNGKQSAGVAQAAAAAAAAAGTTKGVIARAGGESGKDSEDKNPLTGLLHYGSDSDEDDAMGRTSPAAAIGHGVDTTSATSIPRAAEDTSTGEHSLQHSDPAAAAPLTHLPSGWQQCMDQAGLVYFWNTETDETTWEPPGGSNHYGTPSTAAGTGATPAVDVPTTPATDLGESQDLVSDGTSDTASEPDDDGDGENDAMLSNQQDSSNTKLNAAADGAMEPIPPMEGAEGAADKLSVTGNHNEPGVRTGNSNNGDGDELNVNGSSVTKSSNVDEGGHAGEGRRTQIAAAGDAVSVAPSTGVDDLLAGIEAELLSGGGGGDGGGDSDGGGDLGGKRSGNANGGTSAEDNGRERKGKVEDFSSLEQIEPGLEIRAKKTYTELTLCLDKAERTEGKELRGREGAWGRASIQQDAVLQSRVADWKEGGLNGAFFVRRLEDMLASALSSFGPLPSSSSKDVQEKKATPSTTGHETAATVAKNVADTHATLADDDAVALGSEVAEKSGRAAGSHDADRGSSKTAPYDGTPRSSKRKRRGRVGEKDKASSMAGPAPETIAGDSNESRSDGGSGGGDGKGRGKGGADKSDVSITSGGGTRPSSPVAAADAGSNSSWAEEAAEKLRWADEVSAAASAALARARRESAEAKAKAAANEKDASARQEAVSKSGVDASGGKSTEALASPSADEAKNFEGVEDSTRNSHDVKKDGGIAGRTETMLEQESAANETGIVIARDTALPRGWGAIFDETHGAYYYHNLATDETTWVLPEPSSPPAAGSTEKDEATTVSSTLKPESRSRPSSPRGRDKDARRADPKVVEERNVGTPSRKRSRRRKSSDAEDEADEHTVHSDAGKTRRKDSKKGAGGKSSKEDEIPPHAAAAAETATSGGRDTTTKAIDTDEDIAEPSSAAEALPRDGCLVGGGALYSLRVGERPPSLKEWALKELGGAAEQPPTDLGLRKEVPREGKDPSSFQSEPFAQPTPHPHKIARGRHLVAAFQGSPWTSFFDETHQAHYYHNTVTDETTWERPVATVLAASPRASSPIADAEDSIAESVKPTPDLKDKKAPPPEAGADEAPKNPPASTSSASTDDPTSASDRHESPLRGKSSPSSPEASAVAPSPAAPDLRPSTLVWWSDAGDVWNGVSLSGLLTGYGPRRYRNLGGGYYMITLEMGPEWAAAAAAALGQGVADPAAAARLDWVSCSASAPGYGLFLRWAGEDDEQKLFDVPDEFFDDPPPDPRIAAAEEAAANAAAAQAAATAEALAAVENAEAEADAAAAVAATEQAEAAGSEAAAAVAAASAVALPAAPPTTATATATTVKKRKGKGSSAGAIGKKRKGAASLIDKWRAVASTAGEEAEKEAEKQEKMERWKARAAAADPDNPNFMPLGRRRK